MSSHRQGKGEPEGRVNAEGYRSRLLALERELQERLGRDVEAAQDASDDQASTGDLAVVDELKETYFGVAGTDAAILA
jgi:hypothetical protein